MYVYGIAGVIAYNISTTLGFAGEKFTKSMLVSGKVGAHTRDNETDR